MRESRLKVGDRIRLVNILPEDQYPEEFDKNGRLLQTNVWRNGRPGVITAVQQGNVGFSGNHNARYDNDDPHKGKYEDHSYNIQFDRFQYASSSDSHTANGYFLELDGPDEGEVQMAIQSITKGKYETHFLHEGAQDPEFEGMAAYCDFMLGLDEQPRTHTLSSALLSEVNCPLCLSLLERTRVQKAEAWEEGGADWRGYYSGGPKPPNPYEEVE